jgi:hypothetical protein
MKQHKWHKEIKAWADGAEIEVRRTLDKAKWQRFDGLWNWTDGWEFRIKPQPKEQQYLYVYQCENEMLYSLCLTRKKHEYKIEDLKNGDYFYIGKIKLESEE